jgi:hypothetical protein
MSSLSKGTPSLNSSGTGWYCFLCDSDKTGGSMKKDALERVLGVITTLVDATLLLVAGGGTPGELDFGGVKSKRGSELGEDMLGMSSQKTPFPIRVRFRHASFRYEGAFTARRV